MPRDERRERGPRPKVRPGGAIVLGDYRGDLEKALKALRLESAPVLSEARRRRCFAPRQTRGARKRKGIERGRRRTISEAAEKRKA